MRLLIAVVLLATVLCNADEVPTCSDSDPKKGAVDDFITALNGKLGTAKQNETTLATALVNKQKELDAKKGDLGTAKQNETDLATALGQKNKDLENKRRELDAKQGELDKKTKEIAELKGNLTKVAGVLDETNKELKNMTDTVKEKEKEIAKLRRCKEPQVVEFGKVNSAVASAEWPDDDLSTGDRMNTSYITCNTGYVREPDLALITCICEKQLSPCKVPEGTCTKAAAKKSSAAGISLLLLSLSALLHFTL